MNSKRIYIIVPRSIEMTEPPYKLCMSCGRMAAHAAHLAGRIQYQFEIDVEELDLIVLEIPTSLELAQLAKELSDSGVPMERYYDTDKAFVGEQLTAAGTVAERNSIPALNTLKPWKCACNEKV